MFGKNGTVENDRFFQFPYIDFSLKSISKCSWDKTLMPLQWNHFCSFIWDDKQNKDRKTEPYSKIKKSFLLKNNAESMSKACFISPRS